MAAVIVPSLAKAVNLAASTLAGIVIVAPIQAGFEQAADSTAAGVAAKTGHSSPAVVAESVAPIVAAVQVVVPILVVVMRQIVPTSAVVFAALVLQKQHGQPGPCGHCVYDATRKALSTQPIQRQLQHLDCGRSG